MVTRNSVNTYIVPTVNKITMPAQPAFFGYPSLNDVNVTGDGTVYTYGSVSALTIVFDQNSDLNTNGTFTAPVTGKYRLYTGHQASFAAAQTSTNLNIVTSNGTYRIYQNNPSQTRDRDSSILTMGSVLCDLDAADTATVNITSSGATKTVSALASFSTMFCGSLIC